MSAPTFGRIFGGLAYIQLPVSVEDYLEGRLAKDAFEGPLTDNESSGSEGDGDADAWTDDETEASQGEGHSNGKSVPMQPPRPMTRAARKKATSKRQRQEKRAAKQAAEGSDIKHVAKKRRTESTWDVIQVPYNIEENASVTSSGWIGQRDKDLPWLNPTIREAVERDGLTYFPWDGRWAACFCTLPHSAYSALARHIF